MARMKRSGLSEIQPSNFVETNAENWSSRAIEYGKRMGYQPGEWPVIRHGQPEWSEWMGYFERIGHGFAKPGSFASKQGVLTVPSLSPDEFEPGWRSRDFSQCRTEKDRHVRPMDTMSPDEREASRARVASMIEGVKRRVAVREEKRQGWRPPTRSEAREWVAAHEGGQGLAPVDEFSPGLVEMLSEMGHAEPARRAAAGGCARETR